MTPLTKKPGLALVASLWLAGCAGMHGPQGGMGDRDGTTGAQEAPRTPEDMQATCARHRQMMEAKTPEERQALMERHMQGMSPEMRARHMEAMRERCPAQ